MFNFKDKIPCKNIHPGKNSIEFLILHHTAWGTYASNLRTLSWNTERLVSCHFLIGKNQWEVAKIWEPEQIQRHAWESRYWNKTDLNRYSIGIEVVSDIKWLWYTEWQRKCLVELTEHLMKTYSIPKEKVLRHQEISLSGKIDLHISYRWSEAKYQEWKNNLLKNSEKVNTPEFIKNLFDQNKKVFDSVQDKKLQEHLTNTNSYLRSVYKDLK